jgi:hypothetical protein
VLIDWDPVCGATEYELHMEFFRTSDMQWVWYYVWNTPNDFYTVWPVLDADLRFRVRAGDGTNWGSWTEWSQFTYIETP